MFKKTYDWVEIQKDYDSGFSWRELMGKYKLDWNIIGRARKNNLIRSRSGSEAGVLSKKKHPQKHSEETKRKISESRKAYLEKNPDKVPYLLNHYSKKESYPETYFKELFENEKIDLKHHLQVGVYQLDFYNEEKMIDVEIDGEQHYVDNRIAESDVRRTENLESLGWKVFRVRWSSYQRLTMAEKTELVERIRVLVEDVSEQRSIELVAMKEKNRTRKLVNSCLICKTMTHNKKYCSDNCSRISQMKVERPTKEVLEKEIQDCSWVQLGKKYGVSDNTIKKWCRGYGILPR